MSERPLRLLFTAALAAVLVLSLWPLPEPSPLGTGWDKADHVAAFVALGLLGLPSWPAHRSRVLAGLLAYGALIELLQGFTVHRHGDWRDLVADAIGVGIAALVFARWQLRRRTQEQP
jgi:VanZ family protein